MLIAYCMLICPRLPIWPRTWSGRLRAPIWPRRLRAPLSMSQAVAAYLAAMAGLAFVATQLLAFVTASVIALSLPHLAGDGAHPQSRVARWQMAEAQAIPPMPVAKLAVRQRPAVSNAALVAGLESAEGDDAILRKAVSERKQRLALGMRLGPRLRARSEPAAQAFNRSFGVIPVAAN